MNYKMVKYLPLVVFVWLTTFSLVEAQMVWPGEKKAAIVLSYDDGLNSHLNYAIPQLNTYGFKGTFFLYGYLPEDKFDEWRQVSDQGHEIGNHSLYHPCKGNGDNTKSARFYSENYDIPSILREIKMMNKLIFSITGKQPVSYAYPCGETEVAGIDYSDSLKYSGLVKYARKGGLSGEATNTDSLNFFKIPAYSVRPGTHAKELIEYVKKVKKNRQLGVFIFHGIGGDYLSFDQEVHQALLKFLYENRDEFWVTTFEEVMNEIKSKTKDD